MSRKSAERRHDLTADQHQRRLVAMIREFSHAHRVHSVFADFVEICAISISNRVDRSQFEVREKRYLEIVGKYSREEVERFTRMFAELVMSFELRTATAGTAGPDFQVISGGGLTDVLGETYMMLEISNDRTGQFFTPYCVSRMMSAMLMGDGGDEVRKHGFVRLQEPACGAGGMVIAAADALLSAGTNYQQAMHATCVDIDPCCVHMAYVQLSLLHIPAMVVHGNTLSIDVWGLWYTPAHIMGGWKWKLRVRETSAAEEVEDAVDADVPEPTLAKPDEVFQEEAEGGTVAVAIASSAVDTMELAVAPESGGAALLDLFESVADAAPKNEAFFRKVKQLALF